MKIQSADWRGRPNGVFQPISNMISKRYCSIWAVTSCSLNEIHPLALKFVNMKKRWRRFFCSIKLAHVPQKVLYGPKSLGAESSNSSQPVVFSKGWCSTAIKVSKIEKSCSNTAAVSASSTLWFLGMYNGLFIFIVSTRLGRSG